VIGRGLFRLMKDLVQYNQMLRALAHREVASMYVGSFLGFIWTFIQPGVMILVFWFVFSVGFKTKPLNDVPFVVWLTSAMAPWFVFLYRGAAVCSSDKKDRLSITNISGRQNIIKFGWSWCLCNSPYRLDTLQWHALQSLLFPGFLLSFLSSGVGVWNWLAGRGD